MSPAKDRNRNHTRKCVKDRKPRLTEGGERPLLVRRVQQKVVIRALEENDAHLHANGFETFCCLTARVSPKPLNPNSFTAFSTHTRLHTTST